jgi:hypothetical protein
VNYILTVPQRRASPERGRQGSGGLEGIRTRRDDSTSCPQRRRFAYLIGRGCARDVVIVSMQQNTHLACDAAVCAAEEPDEFTVSIACRPLVSTEARGQAVPRSVRHDPTSLRGSIEFGGLLHRRFDLDARPLNLRKNSRSRFFKQPLVVLID